MRASVNAGRQAAATGDPDPGADNRDFSISMGKANLLGLPLFLAMMSALVAPSILSRGFPSFVIGVHGFGSIWLFILLIAAGAVLHELLHGVGWVIAGGGSFRMVGFGIHWKTLTPYAHFTEPLPARAYRVGIVLPGIVVGLLPAVAGYLLGHPALILFGGIFFGAAAGDAIGLWTVRKIPGTTPVLDHPTRVGCVIAGPPGGTAPGDGTIRVHVR